MRERLNRLAGWLISYRIHCFVALVLLAGLMVMQRSETRIASQQDLMEREVTMTYVGEVESIVSRGGINHGSTHFNAGLGLGIVNDVDKNELLKKLRPAIYLPFASVLDMTKAKAAQIENAGPALRIALYRGEIVTVTGKAGPVLSYAEYAAKVEERRDRWAVLAAAAAALALLLLALTTVMGKTRRPEEVGRLS